MIQFYLCILALCLLPVIGHDHPAITEDPRIVANGFHDTSHRGDSSALPPDPASKLATFVPDSLAFAITGIGYFRDDTMLLRYPPATVNTLLQVSKRAIGNVYGEGFFGVTTGPVHFAGDSVLLPLRFAPDTAGLHGVIAVANIFDSVAATGDTAGASIYGTAARIPLHFASGTINFGTVTVGSRNTRSDTLMLDPSDTLASPGTLYVTGYSIAGDITSFSIDGSSVPDSLNALHPGGAPLTVIFQPGAVSKDTLRATLTIHTNYGLRTISLRGNTVNKPVAGDSLTLLPPDAINFKTVPLGQAIDSQFQITNVVSSPVDVTVYLPDSTQFHLTDPVRRFTLAPGTSRSIPIRFLPTATGLQSTPVLISSTGNFTARLNLMGNGFSRTVEIRRDSTLLQQPNALSFTGSVGACTTIPLTIRNTSVDTVYLKSTISGPDALHFSDSLTGDSLKVTIIPGGTVNWLIRFCPVAPLKDSSTKSAIIVLTDTRDTSAELAHLNLSGNINSDSTVSIIGDSLAFLPPALTFGPVDVSRSDTLGVIITNTGPRTISLRDAGIVFVKGTPSVFTVISLPNFITSRKSGTALIRYSPTAATSDTAEWQLHWGKLDSLSIITLTGNGITPAYTVSVGPARARVGVPFTLPVMIAPSPSAAKANWDTVIISLDPASLYLRNVGPAPGQTLRFERLNNDSLVRIIRSSGDLPAAADRLFTLDLIGLTTGSPRNEVGLIAVKMLDGLPVTISSTGSITLDGCDLGKTFDFSEKAAIRAIITDPVSAGATLLYTAPQGTTPVLRLIGMGGSEVMTMELPAGTGGEQRTHLSLAGAPLGFYMLEIRVERDRTTAPIMITR
ncbi:MAG: putative lipoprotein [Chlorobi bacterium]|nr:putative lipoprotein [Chlorobiota bacterium]